MSKKPFVSKEKLDEIAAQYATPFYLYDEAAIRETARRVNKAFAWNQGFKEYFAVKATPNPAILKILHEEGCGADCSSYTELQMADAVGFKAVSYTHLTLPTVLKTMKLCFRPMQRRQKIFSWQGN